MFNEHVKELRRRKEREKKKRAEFHGEGCSKHNRGLCIRLSDANNHSHNCGSVATLSTVHAQLPCSRLEAKRAVGLHSFNAHNYSGSRFYCCFLDTVEESGGSWRKSHWSKVIQLVRLICIQFGSRTRDYTHDC